MSMFANGALQMRVRKHQNETSDHHAEVEVSFFTTAGRTDFTFTKTDIQFMRRECNRILKELEEKQMTGNDYRLEDRPESQKRKEGRPNYALCRMKFAIAVIGLVVSVTLMLTWRDSWNMAGALLVEGVYLATALWLVVRFSSRDDD